MIKLTGSRARQVRTKEGNISFFFVFFSFLLLAYYFAKAFSLFFLLLACRILNTVVTFYTHTSDTMADGPQMQDLEEMTDMDKIAKGWSIAMFYSKERLKRVHELEDAQLDKAIQEGKLVLETLCLFVHACIKRGQYRCV